VSRPAEPIASPSPAVGANAKLWPRLSIDCRRQSMARPAPAPQGQGRPRPGNVADVLRTRINPKHEAAPIMSIRARCQAIISGILCAKRCGTKCRKRNNPRPRRECYVPSPPATLWVGGANAKLLPRCSFVCRRQSSGLASPGTEASEVICSSAKYDKTIAPRKP